MGRRNCYEGYWFCNVYEDGNGNGNGNEGSLYLLYLSYICLQILLVHYLYITYNTFYQAGWCLCYHCRGINCVGSPTTSNINAHIMRISSKGVEKRIYFHRKALAITHCKLNGIFETVSPNSQKSKYFNTTGKLNPHNATQRNVDYQANQPASQPANHPLGKISYRIVSYQYSTKPN